MIQRKQSVYLFLAALLSAGVFFFNLYNYHVLVSGVDTLKQLRVMDDFPSLLIALVITALPFISIFLFGNRKLQIRLCLISILCDVAFITLSLWRVSSLGKTDTPPVSGYYWVGSVLPVIAMVLLFLAISGIRKDEKLVKSVDRLR